MAEGVGGPGLSQEQTASVREEGSECMSWCRPLGVSSVPAPGTIAEFWERRLVVSKHQSLRCRPKQHCSV